MQLLVGLGNPGTAYCRNRHNVGFMAADSILRRHGFSAWRHKFQGDVSDGQCDDRRLLLLRPGTYMNLSGQSVQAAAQFHKIAPEQIIVFHDELDLPPGRVRIKRGGGSGGHNGIKSLDQHLGPDYWRVRIGIGHPGDKSLVNPWVLGDFSAADQHWLAPLLGALAGHLPLLLQGEHNDYLARVSAALPAAADGED